MRTDIRVGGLCMVFPNGDKTRAVVATVRDIMEVSSVVTVGEGEPWQVANEFIFPHRIQGMLYQ